MFSWCFNLIKRSFRRGRTKKHKPGMISGDLLVDTVLFTQSGPETLGGISSAVDAAASLISGISKR